MTKLSVNINKIATLRNARGGKLPDVLKAAAALENFGADGITVHPRPDERHITRQDAYDLKKVVTTEYNIEGYPSEVFLSMVTEIKPEQVTLVPDGPNVLTSNAGWDCKNEKDFLIPIVKRLKNSGIRVSIFLDPDPEQVSHALETGTDRLELYTEAYAESYKEDRELAIAPYIKTAITADRLGLGLNAGHDLNLDNLAYFVRNIPNLMEVSIGHAFISDALYYGLNNVVQMYKEKCKTS